MKAIMLSIQPKWVEKILNCEKIIEVRKRFPSDYVGWVYVYCTKGIKDILWKYKDKYYTQHYLTFTDFVEVLNSKVVARFWCDKVEEHTDFGCMFPYSKLRYNKATCLSEEEIEDYGFIDGKGFVPLDAIHIANLEIFDKPKELSEFYKTRCKNVDENNDCLYCNNNRHCPFAEIDYNPDDSINAYICGEPKKPLTRAPESWQYIEVEE